MIEPTQSTERKPRTSNQSIFAVVNAAGTTSFYRATSTVQARSFHTDELTVRRATIEEIIDIGARGLGVAGLAAPKNDGPQGTLLAEDKGGLIQNVDHAKDASDTSDGPPYKPHVM